MGADMQRNRVVALGAINGMGKLRIVAGYHTFRLEITPPVHYVLFGRQVSLFESFGLVELPVREPVGNHSSPLNTVCPSPP